MAFAERQGYEVVNSSYSPIFQLPGRSFFARLFANASIPSVDATRTVVHVVRIPWSFKLAIVCTYPPAIYRPQQHVESSPLHRRVPGSGSEVVFIG